MILYYFIYFCSMFKLYFLRYLVFYTVKFHLLSNKQQEQEEQQQVYPSHSNLKRTQKN
uniref:Uncharacterized protein n=1 Tax=Octopus bimaculoides TaxID=37653 RepID=A0A0L8GTX0_OCTBM